MLKTFSWQDFLLAATLLSLIWWLGIWLLYYRNTCAKNLVPLAHSWSEEVDELEKESGLMGKAVLEQGVSVVAAEDFSFGMPVSDQGKQLGDLADVQEEVKSICGILAAEDGSKEDFFTLFEMIRNKYPKIASSPSLDSLNVFIRDHVPFALSEEELENIWA
ncbi:hypothetical protein [Pedobacter panaciterrae]|jgi:hypothetical protein